MKVNPCAPTLFLTLAVFSGCGPQLRPSPAPQALIQEEPKQQREMAPMLTFRYRPGRGLTISGDLDYYLGERTSRD